MDDLPEKSCLVGKKFKLFEVVPSILISNPRSAPLRHAATTI